jgi:hypothetical protein
MATFAVIEHMRLDDYAVIQTLETTDIGIGQSITLSDLGHGLNGTHTVVAIPTGLYTGVSDEGDLLFNYDAIIPNQILFYDAGDDLARSAAIPNGTLTWTITCTWTTSANVTEFLGISTATANDTAYIATCVSAANAYCFRARQQAGYHDAPGTAPDSSALLGTTLYAASLYRERGSIDSFSSFSDMVTNQPTGLTMGRIKQLLGIRRSQVA